jgi:RimJ/RimL family protein N-acetyltransferase
MRQSGNPDQWKDSYPSSELISDDIDSGNLYVVKEEERILGVFYSSFGEDETYKPIYGGTWNTNIPYGIIHRIAVAKDAHGLGVSAFCFAKTLQRYGSIRIDTHKDNLPMQRALEKFGFSRRGIIRLHNGEERIAFDIRQKYILYSLYPTFVNGL